MKLRLKHNVQWAAENYMYTNNTGEVLWNKQNKIESGAISEGCALKYFHKCTLFVIKNLELFNDA